MSQENKEQAEKAKEFFKKVSEESQKYQESIPDKGLGDKLKKVEESSKEVVKHIEERKEEKNG